VRVAAIVSVKNEAELIERCIGHLHAIGVDEVLVEDYGSDDGTLERVRALPPGRARLVAFDESNDLDGGAWGSHAAELARSTGADWVAFLDADEFWLPQTGSIKDALASARDDVLTVARFNVPLGPDGPLLPDVVAPQAYGETLLYMQRAGRLRQALDADPLRPWSSGVPAPKVIVRPAAVRALRGGHHKAIAMDGSVFAQVRPGNLLIAHLPFTTRQRFYRKVASIRQTLALQPSYHSGDNVAWHWKRWVQLDDQGLLGQEFDRQVVAPATLDALRAAGTVRSAAEFFSQG
jgi:glycosyltransferase involved in cell wall biosynthesis